MEIYKDKWSWLNELIPCSNSRPSPKIPVMKSPDEILERIVTILNKLHELVGRLPGDRTKVTPEQWMSLGAWTTSLTELLWVIDREEVPQGHPIHLVFEELASWQGWWQDYAESDPTLCRYGMSPFPPDKTQLAPYVYWVGEMSCV